VPTRRLLTALWVLLSGVLVLGVATALTRSGDGGDSSPKAQPVTSQPVAPGGNVSPPGGDPVGIPGETPSPSETTATTAPTTGTDGTPGSTPSPGTPGGGPGSGPGATPGATPAPNAPNMPNTGVPATLLVAAAAASTGALVTRRGVRA
jgi:hypothetical protein